MGSKYWSPAFWLACGSLVGVVTLPAAARATAAAPSRRRCGSEDTWMFEGCPDDGPAMAVDARQRIHIVWPTLMSGTASDAEPTIALFYATSRDGKTFTGRERIPTEGTAPHPRIAVSLDGLITVAWDESVHARVR